MMSWRHLDDPHNPENRNAGNGGDLVKHAVYATLLEVLLSTTPWCHGMRLRECHAGRALYRIPAGDPRRRLLTALHGEESLLRSAQRRALAASNLPTDGSWYAGSAAMNATRLANHDAPHRYEGYEWAPDTRAIARAALREAVGDRLPLCLPDGPPPGQRFEGESYVASSLPNWDDRDVLFLDPFGLWRRRKLAERRQRYARIVNAYVGMAQPPPLAWFFVWSHDEAGEGDMTSSAPPVTDGYQPLLARLREANLVPLIVRWRWDLVCAMWLVVPPALGERLSAALENGLAELARIARRAGVGPEYLEIDGTRA
jgi:hypothetical protein